VITNQVYKDITTGELCPVGGNAFEHLSKTIILFDKTGNSKIKAQNKGLEDILKKGKSIRE
jgi:DNA repair protein RadB